MIKADIVKKLAEELASGPEQLRDKEALEIADSVIDSIKQVIIEHERLEIRDFGVFQVKKRKARIGRNPKNKVEYQIPEHYVVTFKPGKQIKVISKKEQAEKEAEQKRNESNESADS